MYKTLLYNRNTYIHWCVYIETKLQKVYKEQIRERKDGRGVGRHGVHLSTQMHQDYTYRCNSSHLEEKMFPLEWRVTCDSRNSQFGGFEICFVSLVTLLPSCKLLVNFLDQCYS